MRSCTIVIQLCRIFGGPTRRVLLTYLLTYLLNYRVFPDHLMTIAKRYLVIHLHCSRRLSGGQ